MTVDFRSAGWLRSFLHRVFYARPDSRCSTFVSCLLSPMFHNRAPVATVHPRCYVYLGTSVGRTVHVSSGDTSREATCTRGHTEFDE